jgi:FkbM family methyltransferase
MRSAAYAAAQRSYAAALRVRFGRTGMPWRIHDQSIRIDPGVRHLVPHASEPALFRFIQRAVKPGDVVLDIGAFLGIYAILEARRSGPRGRVVALEPTAWSAAMARRHFRFNAGEHAPITLIEAAAGDIASTATLYEYDEPYVNGLTVAVDIVGQPAERAVRVVTVDAVCAELNMVPDFIRMDVQGAEFAALTGARDTIRAAGARLTIVAEMHPQCWPGFGIDVAQALDRIASLGLRAVPLTMGEELFTRDGHVVLRRSGA